jgi:DNA-binding response OmpR family regulator
MTRRLHVLIVTPDCMAARATRDWLRTAGYDVTVKATFAGGCRRLRREPDLLIADVRLRAFNGLHLAMRARWAGIPSIVVGPNDPVLRKEAHCIGTSYICGPVDGRSLAALVETLASMRLARSSRLEWLSESNPIAARRPEAGERFLTH